MKNVIKFGFLSLLLVVLSGMITYTYADSGDNAGAETGGIATGGTTGETGDTGNTGNTGNTETTYTVNYYKHNLGNVLYSLESTATFTGEVDGEVAVSDLVKFITGYTFEVGYLNTGDTTKPTEGTVTTMTISAGVSNVINMYYRPNRLYVQYDVNGGSVRNGGGYATSGSLSTYNGNTKMLRGVYGSTMGNVNTSSYTVNSDGLHNLSTLRINTSRAGYKIESRKEWNSQPNGDGVSYNQGYGSYRANGFAGANLANGDVVVTVYVNRIPIQYDVKYALNGGEENLPNPTKYTIRSGDITLNNPSKTGYTFLGRSGTDIDGLSTGVVITGGSIGNRVFEAVWTLANYNLIYTGIEDCTFKNGENPATYTVLSGDITLNNPSKTGYTFLGRSETDIEGLFTGVVITGGSIGNRNFEAVWQINSYSITYDIDGSNKIIVTGDYNTGVAQPQEPQRNGYKFLGWDTEIPEKMPAENITITAKWEKLGYSGAGRRSSSTEKDDTKDDGKDKADENKKSDDNSKSDDTGNQDKNSSSGTGNNSEQSDGKIDMDDLMNVYIWARDNGITTGETLEAALPDGYIERGEMAKLVVNFVNDVLGREVPKNIPSKCSRGDKETEWESVEEKKYAEQSCALGLMGIYMQNFKPNKLLDRAEFGTIVSRILWGEKFNVPNATTENKYYVKHLNEVKKENLITKIDNPQQIKELRKWIWTVLKKIKK